MRHAGRKPSKSGQAGVTSLAREPLCRGRSTGTYSGRVSHGDDDEANPWGRYVKALTDRDGWSVARLARESGIARRTLFRWIGGSTESVTVESVRLVAAASGDDLDRALRAAAGLALDEEENDDEAEIDFEIRMIEQSSLPEPQKRAMVDFARQLQRRQQAERAQVRERQRAERRNSLQTMIDLAQGGNTNPAT